MDNRGQRTGKNSVAARRANGVKQGLALLVGPKPHSEVGWDMHEQPSFVPHPGGNLTITVTQLHSKPCLHLRSQE